MPTLSRRLSNKKANTYQKSSQKMNLIFSSDQQTKISNEEEEYVKEEKT